MRLKSVRDRWKLIVFILALLLIDRITKLWALSVLADAPEDAAARMDALLRFRFVWNRGAAFSFLRSVPVLVTVLSAAVLLPLGLIILFSRTSRPMALCFVSMVFAGGLGNLYDRLRFGAVIDFIEITLFRFPVFNFADICVTLGAIGFGVLFLCGKDGRRANNDVSH